MLTSLMTLSDGGEYYKKKRRVRDRVTVELFNQNQRYLLQMTLT